MNLKQNSINPRNKAYKCVSKHAPKIKAFSSELWGWYLAGLIDGDGHFNTLGYLVLCFHSSDVLCAYAIKTYIGYGTVSPIQNKNAYKYVLSHRGGRAHLALLIHNKLKHKVRIFKYNTRLVPKVGLPRQTFTPALNLETYWLCGFIQSDGSFQVKALSRSDRKNIEFRTVIQIDQKEPGLLNEIKHILRGYVGYRKNLNTYYYTSVSFYNAVKWISYLDQFCLQAGKMTAYKIWRLCYVNIQQADHVTTRGVKTILKRKCKFNNLSHKTHVTKI